jgi:hypothetical protein
MNCVDSGHLYGVHVREFRSQCQPIVKYGMVKEQTLAERMRQYPKGSLLLASIPVPKEDVEVAETALLAAAKKRFKHRRDLGREYFEWDRMADAIALVYKVGLGFVSSEYDVVKGVALDVAADDEGISDAEGGPDADGGPDAKGGPDAEGVRDDDDKRKDDEREDFAGRRRRELLELDVERRLTLFVRDSSFVADGAVVLLDAIIARFMDWCDLPGERAPHSRTVRNVVTDGFGARIQPSSDGAVVIFPHQKVHQPPVTLSDVVSRFVLSDHVEHRRGAITNWGDFKRAFDAYVKRQHPVGGLEELNVVKARFVLAPLGYEVIREHVCKSCNGRAAAGCCPEYSDKNRVQHQRIRHMLLV